MTLFLSWAELTRELQTSLAAAEQRLRKAEKEIQDAEQDAREAEDQADQALAETLNARRERDNAVGSDEEWRRLNYRLAAAKTDGLTLEHFQVETHELAVAKGFWDHDDGSHQVDSEKIALMHSELSEALDALRDGDMEKVELELADCFIRMLDYCEARDLSLLRGYRSVQEKAQSRPRLHGRKF